MSAFPPSKWDMRFLRDMDTLSCTPPENGGMTMEAFMALRPSGGEEGNFKLVLGGTEKLKISLKISRVLPGQAFTNMVADIELWAGDQIKLEKNSVCSDWWDLEELVSSQDVVVGGIQEGADSQVQKQQEGGHLHEVDARNPDRRKPSAAHGSG